MAGKDRRESDATEELLQGEQGLAPSGSSPDDRKPATSGAEESSPTASSPDDR